ncbi:WD40/YVTN/BNR-like repeat-containing protein [Dactylosporangium sucinum]|uniref:Uncharacterized protein n=1 Tax=Dactylosporangium sucinum TaxID=1424081 RepID=A0A917X650_9ACTN|nr:sialidase family protein [Dactylosporangium sucinum]GGM71449.1 hypothetical protein GCM10007977_086620 [Dactylosporangium sucinum]
MSDDPNRFVDDLRHAFNASAVAQAVRQPALAELDARTAARRRIRRAGIALALVPLLGAAVIMPSTAGGPGPDRPDLEDVQGVQQLVFFSPTDAVAAREVDCAMRFTVTTDGGRTWSPEQATREPLACPTDPLTRPSTLPGLQILNMRTYRVKVDDTWQLTSDGGATWQPAASAVTMVDAFPPGATVVDCGMQCASLPAAPFAIDAASGAVFQLRLTELAGRTVVAYTMAGERLWALLAGSGELDSSFRIAWSTDRGATWQSRSFEPDDMPSGVAAGPDNKAYVAFARRNAADPAERLLQTTDGGSTWSTTVTDLSSNGGTTWPLTVATDGTLLTVEAAGSMRTSRDGAHFARGPVALITGGTPGSDARHGLVWQWDQGRPGTAYVTGNGRTWSEVPLPS